MIRDENGKIYLKNHIVQSTYVSTWRSKPTKQTTAVFVVTLLNVEAWFSYTHYWNIPQHSMKKKTLNDFGKS